MNVIVHMTECKDHSTIASARVARFISATLGDKLLDTKEKVVDVLSNRTEWVERLIIVNGPMAFCPFLEELAYLVRVVKQAGGRVVWVQQDYTIMPPSASSKAESPFRKVFADFGLRPDYWTTCKANVKTPQDQYINWNQLTYNPKEFKIAVINRVLYYGAFREKRIPSFDRYFKDPTYPLTISTTTLRAKKFRELGTGEVFAKPFDNVIAESGRYAAALYIEDEKSHHEYHSPANRFYEMLSAGVPMFFDHQCLPMLEKSGIVVPAQWVVHTGRELADKFGSLDLGEMRRSQRSLWHKDYVGDLTARLKEIAQ